MTRKHPPQVVEGGRARLSTRPAVTSGPKPEQWEGRRDNSRLDYYMARERADQQPGDGSGRVLGSRAGAHGDIIGARQSQKDQGIIPGVPHHNKRPKN